MAQVECPRCRNKIDARAIRCQHCHADFNESDLEAIRQAAGDKRGLIIGVLAVIGLIAAIGSFSQPSSPPTPNSNAVGTAPLPALGNSTTETEDPADRTYWTYSRTRDEVRNGGVVSAWVRSNNSIDLDFPYGTVHLTITVRRHPEWGQDVIFQVDEGQILCRIRDCSGTINFDGTAERLSLNEFADNSSEIVFAQHPQAILRKLQRSRRVIVELPFFQNGNRQFTFSTAGLEWPPPGQPSGG